MERHQGCGATITGTAAASETQAQAAKGDCSTDFGPGMRLAFHCRPHTFPARQSPRPSHFQRAQLAYGTSFRCWGPSDGQRHHLLRQVWSGLLGACGCALPPLQRFPRGESVSTAQIEVWALSLQTLPWLDSRARSPAHPRRGYRSGGAAGVLRGWSGQNGRGAHHSQKATGGSAGSGAGALGKFWLGGRQREPGAAAFRPWAAEFMGGVWAKRSVGVKALPQGWWCSLALTRQTDLATQVVFHGLFSTAQARLRRNVCCGLRWFFQL